MKFCHTLSDLLILFLGLQACNNKPAFPPTLLSMKAHSGLIRVRLTWSGSRTLTTECLSTMASIVCSRKGNGYSSGTPSRGRICQAQGSLYCSTVDADRITDIALQAGMKYITITSKHHDGFCLFETEATDFNVLNSPCGRDLIKELYDACEEKGLGLFLYYSYGADWKHPYFYPREAGWQNARPAYQEAQAEYKFEKEADFQIYVEFVHAQLRELLTQYPHIAGIWFDPIMGYYSRPDLFPIDSTYALVRSLSPHALISFKQGANGEEDFMAPERGGNTRVGQQFEVARKVYELNKDKPKEICNTLQPHAWGYNKQHDGNHKSAEDVLQMLIDAKAMNANLLLNVGPKGDGSFPEEDIDALTEAGEMLHE